jgi:NACHT domain
LPSRPPPSIATARGSARNALDGLPADADLSAFRMRLERLFVPLRVVGAPKDADDGASEAEPDGTVRSVGDFLAAHPRFSLLAKPGGGKSTLLKRLAVAYADPARRPESADDLPDRDWLPLFLRCRDLRDRARRPIRELLGALPEYAGMTDDEAAAFRDQLDAALRAGRVLLLVDGLDEIADEGDRSIFAGHLRTVLGMFPLAAMVVTSREAGYRHVAGVIAGMCDQVSLAPFDEGDVTRLCERWHAQVVRDTEQVRSEARKLAATIWANGRIRSLAESPLMLTTLLVVRRCIGELPNRRVELYKEAVKVLIRTWNTEGFAPMDLDETLAQLSFVACTMMEDGIQRIGRRRLLDLLRQARRELDPELLYPTISPEQFVDRVEYRSSLLMQTGRERIDDVLEEVYEFRHLTFQEYLAARGFVEEQYPGREQQKTLLELLEPHFEDEFWREVVPLAAVLAGRKAEPLVKRLTERCEERSFRKISSTHEDVTAPVAHLLRQCILDEVLLSAPVLHPALKQVGRFGSEELFKGSIIGVRRGKYGDAFQQVIDDAYFGTHADWEYYISATSDLAAEHYLRGHRNEPLSSVGDMLDKDFNSNEPRGQSRAAFFCMLMAFLRNNPSKHAIWFDDDAIKLPDVGTPKFRSHLCRMLSLDIRQCVLAAAWALAHFGKSCIVKDPLDKESMILLYSLWNKTESSELSRYAAWAFGVQPLLPRDTFADHMWGEMRSAIEVEGDSPGLSSTEFSECVVAWYQRTHSDETLFAAKIGKYLRGDKNYIALSRQLLVTLGEPGRRVLNEWEAKQPRRTPDAGSRPAAVPPDSADDEPHPA